MILKITIMNPRNLHKAAIEIDRVHSGRFPNDIVTLRTLPGIGRYIFDAITQRDYPVIQGTVFFFTLVFILINLLVDVLYGVIDPRIKVAGSD